MKHWAYDSVGRETPPGRASTAVLKQACYVHVGCCAEVPIDGVDEGLGMVREYDHVPALQPLPEPLVLRVDTDAINSALAAGEHLEEVSTRHGVFCSDDSEGDREEVIFSVEGCERDDACVEIILQVGVIHEKKRGSDLVTAEALCETV